MENHMNPTGSMSAVYLALNIASAFSYALVAREVITKNDAAQILERIAASTLDDAKTTEEQMLAEPCAGWLTDVAKSYRDGGQNA
jgi:hypothetical protein